MLQQHTMKRENNKKTQKNGEVKEASRKRTHKGRIVCLILAVLVISGFALAYAFAYTVPAEEVEQIIADVQKDDIIHLKPGDVMGNPDWVPEFEAVLEPWQDSDVNRIIFLDLNDSNFEMIAKQYEGFEESKMQECVITAITGDMMECEAPDGSLYELSRVEGFSVGETIAVYFLLAAAA